MDYQISLTARFTLHVQEIGDHIAKSSPASALRWIKELERQIHRLTKFPEGHAPARENKTTKSSSAKCSTVKAAINPE